MIAASHRINIAMAFVFAVRVYIEDTDAGGIVYHANHLKFCERARTEWLRAQGIDHYLLHGEFGFVVHRLSIDYRQPALMDDLLQVSIEVLRCQSASFTLRQQIHRDAMLLADVEVSLACLDANLRPRRLPDSIRTLIQAAMV
jgi:acyl-CoA thioester hydrolase